MTLAVPDPAGFVLVLARLAGLVLAAPVLGHGAVPMRVRAGLAALLAIALAPVVPPAVVGSDVGPWTLGGLVAIEAALGALVGSIAQLALSGAVLGGQLAGVRMGFGLQGLMDPAAPAQVTGNAQWQQLIVLLVFLGVDAHHVLLGALEQSFVVVPPGAVVLGAATLGGTIGLISDMLALGVRVAAPVLVALLVVNGALGVLARAVPQLNVFVASAPVSVGVGLVVLAATLPVTVRMLGVSFDGLHETLGAFVRELAHG